MDDDIIDFNNLRDHLNFATDTRKLQRERDYLEYNLDKLIFAGLKNIPKKPEICLSMDIKDTTGRLFNECRAFVWEACG